MEVLFFSPFPRFAKHVERMELHMVFNERDELIQKINENDG